MRQSSHTPVDVSIVVPAFDAADVLGAQLASLARSVGAGAAEIIVADNGSRDATVDVACRAASMFANFRVVDASRVRGPSAARNCGAQLAHGRYVAFVDADDLVVEGWFEAVSRFIDTGAQFFTGPVVPFDGDPPKHDDAVTARTPAVHLDFLPYAFGGNLIVERSLFVRVGGFDEALAIGEDVELSWRLQQQHAIALSYQRDAVILQRQRPTAKALFRQYVAYGRADPGLHASFVERGAPPMRGTAVARAYGGLVVRVLLLWHPAHRARFVRQLGRRIGRLKGSWDVRHLYL